MAILVKNIKKLIQVENQPVELRAGKEMQTLICIDDAFLITKGELIYEFGTMDQLTDEMIESIDEPIEEIDAAGKMVFPSFCDSHTHLVYAGSREIEYIDKIKGLSYIKRNLSVVTLKNMTDKNIIKVLKHEFLHGRGLSHCTHKDCLMNSAKGKFSNLKNCNEFKESCLTFMKKESKLKI